jgi:predicted phage terminase large subunit-like protein
MIKSSWFANYRSDELPANFERVVQSWDTANKATELSDFSVCTTWGIKQKRIYLLHVLRRRMDYPELKRVVREQQQLHRASVVLIEDKASGTQLIQELISEGSYGVKRYKPELDKVMRMHAQTAIIENGFVYLPREAPWLPAYLHELATFPMGRHDDQVDSTSQFLDWFKLLSQVQPTRYLHINWMGR